MVARWPRRQPRQLRQRARAAWAGGRFSTERSALKPRGTGFGCSDYDLYIPLPPIWRGVGVVEPRPTARDGARPVLAVKTTTRSPPARACSVGGRTCFHRAKRAHDVCRGIRTRLTRPIEGRAADLCRCWCGRAPADGVERSVSRVGPHNKHAKSPSPRCAAHAPWAVGRLFTGRKARETRVTGFEHCDQHRSNAVPPTCLGVGADKLRPLT